MGTVWFTLAGEKNSLTCCFNPTISFKYTACQYYANKSRKKNIPLLHLYKKRIHASIATFNANAEYRYQHLKVAAGASYASQLCQMKVTLPYLQLN